MFVWKTGGITDYEAEARKLRQVPDVTGAAPGRILGRALITSRNQRGFHPAERDRSGDRAKRDRHRLGDAQWQPRRAEDRIEQGTSGRSCCSKDLAGTLGVVVGDSGSDFDRSEHALADGDAPADQTHARRRDLQPRPLCEFDSQWGYVSLDVARRLSGKERVDFIQLRVHQRYV